MQCDLYMRGVGNFGRFGERDAVGAVQLLVNSEHDTTAYKLGVFYDPVNETAVFFVNDALYAHYGADIDRSRAWRFVLCSHTPAEISVNATAMLPQSAAKYFQAFVDPAQCSNGDGGDDDAQLISADGAQSRKRQRCDGAATK